MKEKDTPNFEKLLSNELACLKGIESAATVTLITLDVAIPASADLLAKLGLEPDGWKVITSKELDGFLVNFKEVFGKNLESFVKEREGSLRLGGSVFTTLCKLLELKPELDESVGFVPVGKENGEGGLFDNLIKEVNQIRKKLLNKLSHGLNNRILIEETASPGITPIILSFYQDKGRSMVLIRDEQEVKIPEEVLTTLQTPNLLLVDARELTQESYLKEAIRLARRPESFVVVGLGADSVVPQVIEKVKMLQGYTGGEVAFAGNGGEVDALLKNWGGVRNISELMLETKLRFLLETDGQNGATLYFRIGDRIHSATFSIPIEQIFEGDTTNAGDIFLALIIQGLMDEAYTGGSVEDWLYKILENASKGTLEPLKERAKDSSSKEKDRLGLL